MNKLKVLGLLMLMPLIVIAGAPNNTSTYTTTKSTVICSTQITESWQIIDSLVVLRSDTAGVVYSVSGTVVLEPGDKLWIGLLNGGDGDNNAAATDTFTFEWPDDQPYNKTVSICGFIRDSSSASTTDTVFVTMSVRGSSQQERVTVSDFSLVVTIVDIADFE